MRRRWRAIVGLVGWVLVGEAFWAGRGARRRVWGVAGGEARFSFRLGAFFDFCFVFVIYVG